MREKAALARGVALLGVKVPGPSYSMYSTLNVLLPNVSVGEGER